MHNAVECTSDRFAATLSNLLQTEVKSVKRVVRRVSRRNLNKATEKLVDSSNAHGWNRVHKNGKTYAHGFQYRMKNNSEVVFGEVGNKDFPGLVHLLEKGHARTGGGRVAGIEHVAPVADEVFAALIAEMSKEVGDAL